MKYSLGESLADFGFHFLEKLHEPIFLVNKKLRKLVKVNEAGRKFLHVTHLSAGELDKFVTESVLNRFTSREDSYRRLALGSGSKLIARSFIGSDLILIEVKK